MSPTIWQLLKGTPSACVGANERATTGGSPSPLGTSIGKAHGLKHPRVPSVRWLWKEESAEAVLDFLRGTRVGCISTRGCLLEERYEGGCEEAGAGDEGEEGGPGSPAM